MLYFRVAMLLALVGGAACFVAFVVTGDARWKRRGIGLVKWTLIAAFGFFAVLFVGSLTDQL